MINKATAQELEALAFTIHGQILSVNNKLDTPHELALRSLHNTLANMVTEGATDWHRRFCFAGQVGIGKSTAIAAHLAAAYQMNLLGNGLSYTFAASRVEQLFDFEEMLLDAGIPANELRKYVSVLHSKYKTGDGVKRLSDEAWDTPILLVTHERIKKPYRPKKGFYRQPKDLLFFQKYKGEDERVVIWDERCQIGESESVKLLDLQQAVASLKVEGVFKPSVHGPLVKWLDACLVKIKAATAKVAKDPLVPVELTTLPDADVRGFYNLVASRECYDLNRESKIVLLSFLEQQRFRMRVFATGLITIKRLFPNTMQRVLVLDASYNVNALSKLDKSIVDLETVHPMLQRLKSQYGKTLATLKSYRTCTFIHWNVSAGKDKVSSDLTAYLEHRAEGGNLILEVVEVVKCWLAEGRNILLWTFKAGRTRDQLGDQLRSCLAQAGLMGQTFVLKSDQHGEQIKSRVVVDTYGQHDGVNQYACYDAVIHLGVQQREDLNLNGDACAIADDILSEITAADTHEFKTTDQATVLHQSNGRGSSRNTDGSVARPQVSFGIWLDRGRPCLSETIKPFLPGMQWEDYKPVYAAVTPQSFEERVDGVAQFLRAHREPIKGTELQDRTGNLDVPTETWRRTMNKAAKEAGFQREGHWWKPVFQEEAVAV